MNWLLAIGSVPSCKASRRARSSHVTPSRTSSNTLSNGRACNRRPGCLGPISFTIDGSSSSSIVTMRLRTCPKPRQKQANLGLPVGLPAGPSQTHTFQYRPLEMSSEWTFGDFRIRFPNLGHVSEQWHLGDKKIMLTTCATHIVWKTWGIPEKCSNQKCYCIANLGCAVDLDRVYDGCGTLQEPG